MASPVRKNCGGFTLMEVMVTLVLGVIVIVVGSVGVGQALEATKVRSEVKNLNELLSAAQGLRSPAGYPAGMISLLRGMKQLPPAFADPGGDTLVNAWGGDIELTSTSHATLVLTIDGLPGGACARLARRFVGSDRVQVRVGGQQIPQLDLEQAELRCQTEGGAQIELVHNA